MTRARLVVFSALLVVAAGSIAALGVLALSPARAAVGPLPSEALVLPAGTSYVMGLDVKRFTASAFYRRYAKDSAVRPQAFSELEQKTGINPERDLDWLVLAGSTGKPESSLGLVSGSFDRYKLGRHLEGRSQTTSKKLHGSEVYLFREGSKGASALAFLGDHSLVVGEQAAVEATLASHAEGRRPLRSNAALIEMLSRVKPGSTVWMVGDQGLLAQMPKTVPGPGGAGGSQIALPALQSLTLTGDLDPIVSLEITGAAADEAAAKSLADVVRGFVALATLQAGQRPELKGLGQAVSVTTLAKEVHVTARFPYELLDALKGKPAEAQPVPKETP